MYERTKGIKSKVFLGGGVSLVGPQEQLRGPSGYTPRGFTLSPGWEAKYGFSGFILMNKRTNKQTNRRRTGEPR